MKSYRCTICGEVSLGSKAPSNCPFCGVRSRHISLSEEVDGRDIFNIKNISDDSRRNLMASLNMETSNASFYKCASESSESEEYRALFKRLAKIEREHADIIRKYLGLDPVEFTEQECSTDDDENLEKALVSTKEIIKFYKVASIESRESKISGLFKALGEVEESCYKLLATFCDPTRKEKEEFVPPLYSRVGGK